MRASIHRLLDLSESVVRLDPNVANIVLDRCTHACMHTQALQDLSESVVRLDPSVGARFVALDGLGKFVLSNIRTPKVLMDLSPEAGGQVCVGCGCGCMFVGGESRRSALMHDSSILHSSHTHARTRTHTHARTHTHIHSCSHTHTHMHTHIHIHTQPLMLTHRPTLS